MSENAAISYFPARTEADLLQILRLQKANLFSHLQIALREKEGFVTLSYPLQLLKQMQASDPQLVAFKEEKLIGYALCLHPRFRESFPEIQTLFQAIASAFPGLTQYRVMGQICIAKSHRGKGHFRRLYQALKSRIHPLPLFTAIDQANSRSLLAHYAIGFEKLAEAVDGSRKWALVMWK